MKIITKFGDGYLWGLIATILFIDHSLSSLLILYKTMFAFTISMIIYNLIKLIAKRERPFTFFKNQIPSFIPNDRYSFPSGHSTIAFTCAVIIGIQIPYLLIPLLIIASLIAFSRVVLGVHYPLDVLIGSFIGTLTSVIVYTYF